MDMTRSSFLLVLCLGLGACASGPFDLLREASGAVSQILCSKTFVSGLDPEAVYHEHLRPEPGMGLISWAIDYEVDRARREVRANVAGSFARRSVYRAGRGCTLSYPDHELPAPLNAPAAQTESAAVSDSAALQAALALAFAEPGSGASLGTKAVVVMHGQRIVAERYADGYGPATPLLSHSLAKSFSNALIGVLVRQGKLSVTRPLPDRAGVSIDQLLRMNAGYGFDESGGASIATDIWFNRPDTVAASARAERVSDGWGYSSRAYMLLSRIAGDAIGGGPQGVRDFVQRELIEPLGMRNVTLEFDAAGTMMGAHAIFATPRDWARFGSLYLRDGRVGRERILPEGWVEYSTRPTPGTGYGAGFWLNNTQARMPTWDMHWGLPGAPRDAFMARGDLGQFIVIVPSADLVIVRQGVSHERQRSVASVARLVSAVIAALRSTADS